MPLVAIAHRASETTVVLRYSTLDAARAARRGGMDGHDLLHFGPDAFGEECWIRKECLASVTVLVEPEAAPAPAPAREPPRIVTPDLIIPATAGKDAGA